MTGYLFDQRRSYLRLWFAGLAAAMVLLLLLPAEAAAAPTMGELRQSGSFGEVWYTVKKGDTLYSIARRHGVTVSAISKANAIKNPNRIYAGQKLRIPSTGSTPPSGQGFWYEVQRGDTVYSIARRHGLTVDAIVRANGLASADVITAGQKLWLPTTAGPPGSGKPWTGLYYSNRTLSGPPARTENVAAIDFEWSTSGPAGLPSTNFSAVWTGTFRFDSGIYRFLVNTDDGARFYLNDTLIINAWRDQSATGYFRDYAVTAGEHIVRVEYYQGEAAGLINVTWRRLE